MDDNHKLFEQIESYLSGTMEPKEQALFEKKMQNDRVLRAKVERFKLAQDAILAGGRNEIRNSVDAAFEKYNKATKPIAKTVSLRRIFSMAAAVLLLAVFTFFLTKDRSPQSPQELFAAHFELPVATNVRGEDGVQSWNKTIQLFNDQNYDQYIKAIKPLLNDADFSFRNEGYLFLGLSYLQLDEYNSAISAFQQVSRISSSAANADWYLALTWLKMNDLDNAKLTLQKIVETDQAKKREASQILGILIE